MDHFVALHARDERKQRWMNMKRISNQFTAYARVDQSRTGNARIAMIETRLRVEQMRHVPHTRFNARARLIEIRRSMPH